MTQTVPQDDRLALTQLARELDVTPVTVRRWATTGVRGVVLDAVVIGGRSFTSRAAYKKFCQLVTAARRGMQPIE